MRSMFVLCICGHAALACDDAGPLRDAAAAPPVADAGVGPPPSVEDAGAAEVCAMLPTTEAFGMVPDPELTVAIDVVNDDGCDDLYPWVLVVNTSTRIVRVMEVAVDDPRFSASADALPLDLAPGASFPVRLAFEAEAPEQEATATLLVRAQAACQRFMLLEAGLGAAEALQVERLAIDFGDVPPGQRSQPIDVAFLPRGSTEGTFSAGSALPADTFQVLSSVSGELQNCVPFVASVRMTAPAVEGQVEGDLLWELSTRTSMGEFHALGVVKLRGNAKEP